MKSKHTLKRKHSNIVKIVLAACILLVCAATFAWFYNRRNLSTFIHVEQPSVLAIKGYHKTEVVQLDFSAVDLTDESRKAAFVFCITGKDCSKYRLELAHTTNVPFNYTIRQTQEGEPTENQPVLTYTDSNGTYRYSTGGAAVTGNYINKGYNGLAVLDGGAQDKHGFAYDTYEKAYVEAHVEPIYCLYDNISVRNRDQDTGEFADYYILELTWDETTAINYEKETDLVYLLAESIEEAENKSE